MYFHIYCFFVLKNLDFVFFRSLHKIPQPIRFQIAGAINTLGFLLSSFVFNKFFHERYHASTLYLLSSIAYFPIGHANTSLMVFGWPSPYLPNLLMNMPIGFGGIAIGTLCTGILDRLEFDDFMRGVLSGLRLMTFEKDDDGNMFSSLLVMIITGVWGYVLSTMVNGKKTPKKKTDKGDKDL
jgi:hypothetical protein